MEFTNHSFVVKGNCCEFVQLEKSTDDRIRHHLVVLFGNIRIITYSKLILIVRIICLYLFRLSH